MRSVSVMTFRYLAVSAAKHPGMTGLVTAETVTRADRAKPGRSTLRFR